MLGSQLSEYIYDGPIDKMHYYSQILSWSDAVDFYVKSLGMHLRAVALECLRKPSDLSQVSTIVSTYLKVPDMLDRPAVLADSLSIQCGHSGTAWWEVRHSRSRRGIRTVTPSHCCCWLRPTKLPLLQQLPQLKRDRHKQIKSWITMYQVDTLYLVCFFSSIP